MLHEAPSAATIAKALQGRRTGTGYQCKCPAHDDQTASLSITVKDGKVLFKCHAGCSQEAVLAALEHQGLWHSKPNGRTNGSNGHSHTNSNGRQQPRTERPAKVVATYPYSDENGLLVFEVVRLEPKGFRQRRPDGSWGVQGVRQVPYRLPELIEAIAKEQPVFVTEGEKDADNLAKLNITATCNAGGAGKWKSEHAAFLKDADVVIIPDNDNPGRDHADAVAISLQGIAQRVRVLELPGLPDKEDVTWWLEKGGGTVDKLWHLVEKASDWQPKADQEEEPLQLVEGDDDEPIPPRQWVLGTTFCKEFVSAVVASGATGKTALRLLQLLAIATGRDLTREHVFFRGRVLFITLEDNENEIRRRVRAARLYHKIAPEELKGRFYRIALGRRGGKLVAITEKTVVPGPLAITIEKTITAKQIDVVCFDPFIKAHGVEENDNTLIDEVMQILTDISDRLCVAIDTAHHTTKGMHTAGHADHGRGASSMKDALRIGKTLMPMSPDEADTFGISEHERRFYIRYDDAKANLTPFGQAKWFKLVSVPLGNATDRYPAGDNVQTVEPWVPPDLFSGISNALANEILDVLDAGLESGERYSSASKAEKRAAWKVVSKLAKKDEKAARRIINTWVKNKVLTSEKYYSQERGEDAVGLVVDPATRPS